MKIVICCTRNWYIHLATMLYALFKHNKIEKVYLFIEDDEISYLKDKRIEFININKTQDYISKNSPNYYTKYTKLSLIRCYFSKILKEDKILYIDADALIVDNIEELWNIDLEGYVLAGVKEEGEWDKHLGIEGLNGKYINSGVLLINLKKIREEKLDDEMIYLLNKNKYAYPDQDVINIICKNKIKYIEPIYNSAITTGIVDNAKIIHYIRDVKGWISGKFRSEIWYNYHIEMLGGVNMDNFKVRATKNFDDITVQDEKGRNVKRVKDKSEWFCSKERYEYLKSNNAVELIEVEKVELPQVEEQLESKVEVKPKKKKTSKKK